MPGYRPNLTLERGEFMSKKRTALDIMAEEFLDKLDAGRSAESILQDYDFLHSISQSRLIKRVQKLLDDRKEAQTA